MKCSAMIKHKGDEFYHQCGSNATRFGFCGTHLSNWTPKLKTPRIGDSGCNYVTAYTHCLPPKRLAFRLIPESKMMKHSWWLKQELRVAVDKCIDETQRMEERRQAYYAQLRVEEASIPTCPTCGERFTYINLMHMKPITTAQGTTIISLIKICVLTDQERATILERLLTHDRAWAFKSVHKLLKHTAKVGSLDLDAQPF